MRTVSLTLVSLGAALLIAGCSSFAPQSPAGSSPPPVSKPTPAPPPEPIGKSTAPPGDICDAKPAQGVVGQQPTVKVIEQARVRSGARMARVLRPGQMVTKEFDQQRLNLELDANGKIIAARCG